MLIATGAKQPFTQQGSMAGAAAAMYTSRLVIKGNGNTNLSAVENGDWSLVAPSTDLEIERREAGAWVDKQTITP